MSTDDCAERVEQKVRLQLHLQRAQVRGRQLLRELGRVHLQLKCLPLTSLGVLVRSVHGLERDHRPIPNDAPLDAEREHHVDAGDNRRWRRRGWKDTERDQQRHFDDGGHDREDDAEGQMDPCVADAPLERPPAAKPQERRGERGADVHARHPTDEHVPPRHRLTPIEAWHRVLGDVEQPGYSPGEPESRNLPDPLPHPR